MNGQFLPRKNPAKTVKGRGFLDRGLMEFEEAKRDLLADPNNAQYWAIKLQQYPAAFMKTAIDAIQLSGKLIEEWL